MKLYLAAITVAVISVFWGFKGAQSDEIEAGASTDPVVVVVNKARILRLEGEADVVLVANPEIADVVIDSPSLLFVLGLTAGETSLLVLDKERDEVLVTNIRVVSNEATASFPEKEVEVTRVKLLRRTEQSTLECTPRCLEGEGQAGSPQVSGSP